MDFKTVTCEAKSIHLHLSCTQGHMDELRWNEGRVRLWTSCRFKLWQAEFNMSACFLSKLDNKLWGTSRVCQRSFPLSTDKCFHRILVHFGLKFSWKLNVLWLKEFCSAVLWDKHETLFQKYLCLIVFVLSRSSIFLWSLRSISWWLAMKQIPADFSEKCWCSAQKYIRTAISSAAKIYFSTQSTLTR